MMRAAHAVIGRAARLGLAWPIPEPLKGRLGRQLARLRLFDPELHKLGLSRINADDVFLCSYPKSGNTWLRFLIAHLMAPGETISFRTIDRFVPEIERAPFDLEAMARRPVMKTHCAFLSRFPRAIYVCRDPRDALVSCYHYAVRKGWFAGDISSFLATQRLFGAWDRHVESALAERERRPEAVLLLRYEDLIADIGAKAREVAAFLMLDTGEAALQQAIEATSFARLKDNEREHGGETGAADGGFFRRGIRGAFDDELPAEDAARIVARYGATMRRAGYL